MNHTTESLEKTPPPSLLFKVCLEANQTPHYFDSYQSALKWLRQHGKGRVKKKSVIEFAFPLEQKISREVWTEIYHKTRNNALTHE